MSDEPPDGARSSAAGPPSPGVSEPALERAGRREAGLRVTRQVRIQPRTTTAAVGAPTVREVLRGGARRLDAAGLPHAQQEAAWLLGSLLAQRPIDLYVREAPVPETVVRRFFEQVAARGHGVPLQYLMGHAAFDGLELLVRPGVFIPRPETESLVDAVLPFLRALSARRARPLRLLDVGTGSGCIALALARHLPACTVVGVELSWNAVRIANANADRHGLAHRVWMVQGEWSRPIGAQFDGIVANPPYIPSRQVDQLPLDVRREPRLSLDGGADGLNALRTLLTEAPDRLEAGGVLALECGEEQAAVLTADARARRWVEAVTIVRDLAGRPRGVIVVRTS